MHMHTYIHVHVCMCTCIYFPSHVVMRHEVSCVDITPVGERKDKADLCAIGLWTEIAVQVLFLPSLEVVHTQMLGGGE